MSLDLAANHDFFRPEVGLANGSFLWLSPAKPSIASLVILLSMSVAPQARNTRARRMPAQSCVAECVEHPPQRPGVDLGVYPH